MSRYYPLIDEIKNHVFQWATDEEWKKLPKALNVALTQVMNEIKIYESLKSVGKLDDREDSNIKKDKMSFINIFKKKYLELTDLEFKEPVTPINQVNIERVIQTVNREGGNFIEFLDWYFDDFCSLECNKKYLPPTINGMCQSFIISKYLFVMKDTLKMRKKEMDNMAVRNMLLGIAIPFVERTKSKEFSQKIIDFSESKISSSKFFDLMKKFAEKLNDQIAIDACKNIDSKRNSGEK